MDCRRERRANDQSWATPRHRFYLWWMLQSLKRRNKVGCVIRGTLKPQRGFAPNNRVAKNERTSGVDKSDIFKHALRAVNPVEFKRRALSDLARNRNGDGGHLRYG